MIGLEVLNGYSCSLYFPSIISIGYAVRALIVSLKGRMGVRELTKKGMRLKFKQLFVKACGGLSELREHFACLGNTLTCNLQL